MGGEEDRLKVGDMEGGERREKTRGGKERGWEKRGGRDGRSEVKEGSKGLLRDMAEKWGKEEK